MPHGFDLPPELQHSLRSAVPAEAIAWVEAALGRGVVGAVALEGGASSAIHRLALEDGRDVVLRRFVLDWIRDEPWLPANEARVLAMLGRSSLPAPTLLAADVEGAVTGSPMVLMSALAGNVVWAPESVDDWLDELVRTVVAIHATPVTDELMTWRPYAPEGTPQQWSRHPEAWARAVAAFEGPEPARDDVFVHRDFHPGNVLWTAGRVSGVVDWVSSCVGPAEEDIAHCRINLASSHGLGVADAFLARWLAATGRDSFNPYYDLVTAVSIAGTPSSGLDAFVAAAARSAF